MTTPLSSTEKANNTCCVFGDPASIIGSFLEKKDIENVARAAIKSGNAVRTELTTLSQRISRYESLRHLSIHLPLLQRKEETLKLQEDLSTALFHASSLMREMKHPGRMWWGWNKYVAATLAPEGSFLAMKFAGAPFSKKPAIIKRCAAEIRNITQKPIHITEETPNFDDFPTKEEDPELYVPPLSFLLRNPSPENVIERFNTAFKEGIDTIQHLVLIPRATQHGYHTFLRFLLKEDIPNVLSRVTEDMIEGETLSEEDMIIIRNHILLSSFYIEKALDIALDKKDTTAISIFFSLFEEMRDGNTYHEDNESFLIDSMWGRAVSVATEKDDLPLLDQLFQHFNTASPALQHEFLAYCHEEEDAATLLYTTLNIAVRLNEKTVTSSIILFIAELGGDSPIEEDDLITLFTDGYMAGNIYFIKELVEDDLLPPDIILYAQELIEENKNDDADSPPPRKRQRVRYD
jgi:hypothetical protein